MNGLSALISAVTTGKAELLQLALIELQQSLRLTAAVFLPTMREVDTVVRRLGTTMASELSSIPRADPMAWVRIQLRRLIAQYLDELGRNPVMAGDPLFGRLITSGRERLKTVPIDADMMTPLNQRLRFMSKGAIDLLILRFNKNKSFPHIATQRLISLDDVSDAIQTACRQLDWTGDASGTALDASDYRVVDGVVCGDDGVQVTTDQLSVRLQENIGLSLRFVRAARQHVIAAAWYASPFTVEMPVLAPPVPVASSTPTAPSKRPSNAAVSVTKSGMISTPTKRQPVPFNKSGSRKLDDYPEQGSKSGLFATIISGFLVLSGVGLLLLRSGTNKLPDAEMSQEPATTQALVANSQTSINTPPVTGSTVIVNAATVSISPVQTSTVITPTVVSPTASMGRPLFSSGSPTAPLAAWSTRLIISDYKGPLLRIRRNSDDHESDIGATTSGSLDTGMMMLFISGKDANVVCWYDQSGNNHHLRQTEFSKQPSLVKNGVLNIENSRPIIYYHSRMTQYLTTPAGIPIGCLYAVVSVDGQKDHAQAIMGSLSDAKGDREAYYPILDRKNNGLCEWWMGQVTGIGKINVPIPQKKLLLWHSSSDGTSRPKLTLRLDGKQVGEIKLDAQTLVAKGPTAVGAGYWNNQLSDYFAGVMGEIIILPPGSRAEDIGEITKNLKSWWRTP